MFCDGFSSCGAGFGGENDRACSHITEGPTRHQGYELGLYIEQSSVR